MSKKKLKKRVNYITYKNAALLSIIVGVGIFVVFIILLLFGNYKFSGTEITLDSIDLTYKIGSFLGAVVGPFWALAGVFLYYTALNYQKEDLKKSQEAYEIQSFETTFFNLLKRQREISTNLKGNFVTVKNFHAYIDTTQGPDYFSFSKKILKIIYNSLKNENYSGVFDQYVSDHDREDIERYTNDPWEQEHQLKKGNDSQCEKAINKYYEITEKVWVDCNREDDFGKICKSYELFFKKHHHEIGHYFRHLYNIVKFIDSSEKEFSKRDIKFRQTKYANFIQAQMSSLELMLLFYNVLLFPKARRLVIKYNLLDNLTKDDLICESDFRDKVGISLKTSDELLKSEMVTE